MRWRGVCHVKFAVLDYGDSIAFYDKLFGWLGYSSFSSLNMEYQSTYYMTRNVKPHSYIGIQPARIGAKLMHTDQAVGINRIALWARSRGEVDRFHREFLVERGIPVTEEPQEYPQILARLLRGVLRRPDQRDSLGIDVRSESDYTPPTLGVLLRDSGFRQESARSGEHGAKRRMAGQENPAGPVIRDIGSHPRDGALVVGGGV